jgi:hypothetical protein
MVQDVYWIFIRLGQTYPADEWYLEVLGTKGETVKVGTTDRTPRETLEERLEKTPSNARCFAQGSSLLW